MIILHAPILKLCGLMSADCKPKKLEQRFKRNDTSKRVIGLPLKMTKQCVVSFSIVLKAKKGIFSVDMLGEKIMVIPLPC